MKELFDASFSVVNFIPTTLLVLVLIYWFSVLIGFLDLSFLDVDVDTDVYVDADVDVHAEVDVDAHAEVDAHADAHADADPDHDTGHGGHGGAMSSLLAFFNLGKVPMMFLLSFLSLPLWIISVMVNYTLGNQSFLFSLVLFVPNFIVSLFIAKFLTQPFARMFERMDKDAKEDESFIGKIAKVTMAIDPQNRFGQIELNYNNSPVLVNAVSNGNVSIAKGDTCLIIDYIEDKKCYLVEPYKI